ncbi:MAG: hypothetical protein ACLFR0_00485 [Alphaproteobacteria bacterium]
MIENERIILGLLFIIAMGISVLAMFGHVQNQPPAQEYWIEMVMLD